MAKHCFVMACQTKSYYYYCKTVPVEDLIFERVHFKLDYHKVRQILKIIKGFFYFCQELRVQPLHP